MTSISKNFLGNEKLVSKFFFSFSNKKMPNSMILSGLKGIGKTTLAFYLINILYESISKENVKKMNKNLIYNFSHPNIRYVTKEFDEKNKKYRKYILIDQIRNLENFLYQSSFDNLPKFVIIDSADDLNNNSSNALLKILEEPKNNTYFFLIAHQLFNLLPTIRSRCIKFNVEKPNQETFKNILIKNEAYQEGDDFDFLYSFSCGSPGFAIDINSLHLDELFKKIMIILTTNEIFTTDIIELSNFVEKFTNDEFRLFLVLLKHILTSIAKISLGIYYNDNSSLNINYYLKHSDTVLKYHVLIKILEYINNNEKDLFIFNLDKKIFCLNIFSPLNDRL